MIAKEKKTGKAEKVYVISSHCIKANNNRIQKHGLFNLTNIRTYFNNRKYRNPQLALSIDQMKELESMGMDISDASFAWAKFSWKSIFHKNHGINYFPAYTLEDILLKLPPNPVIDSWGYKLYFDRVWFGTSIGYQHCVHVKILYETGYMPILEAAFTLLKWSFNELPKLVSKQSSATAEIRPASEIIIIKDNQ